MGVEAEPIGVDLEGIGGKVSSMSPQLGEL